MGAIRAKLVGILSGALLVAAIGAPSASAMTTYLPTGLIVPRSGTFIPGGMAVDQSTGDLYVAGAFGVGNIHRFAGGTQAEAVFGEGHAYNGVALDPVDKLVYGLEPFAGKIATFELDGEPVIRFSDGGSGGLIGADAAGHVFYPRNGNNGIREFDAQGTLLQTVSCSACPETASFSSPKAVAFDSAGDLYVADTGNSRVIKFENEGGEPTAFGNPTIFAHGAATAVAVDPQTGNVFVGGNDGTGFHVKGYEPSGTQFTDFGAGILENVFPSFGGDQLAVDPSTGGVIVDDLTGQFETKIWTFTPVFAPTASTGPASEVTQTTATLNATVTPGGEVVTDCHIEYGTTAAYGRSAPCTEYPGFVNEPVSVSGEATGLEPNTTYHYRVVASNEFGTAEGADETFTTLIEPPSATTGAASGIAQTAATIAGTVNPGGNPVTACRFEYGTTAAYGKQAACPTSPGSGTSNVPESIALSGLQANTTYHYRIVATNAGGIANGQDASFTTLPKAPAVSTGAASKIGPDTAKLAGSVNPEGSATTYDFEYGTSTAYGKSTATGKASGIEAKAVSALLSGLEPATTYHYRLTATNAGGTAKGADQTFTTGARPIGHVEIPATALIKGGKAKIPLDCKGVAIATCQGTLTLRARLKQGIRFVLVKIGQADFQISGGVTETVSVALNGNGKKALAQAEGKPLKAIVSAGGANREIRLSGSHAKKKHRRHG